MYQANTKNKKRSRKKPTGVVPANTGELSTATKDAIEHPPAAGGASAIGQGKKNDEMMVEKMSKARPKSVITVGDHPQAAVGASAIGEEMNGDGAVQNQLNARPKAATTMEQPAGALAIGEEKNGGCAMQKKSNARTKSTITVDDHSPAAAGASASGGEKNGEVTTSKKSKARRKSTAATATAPSIGEITVKAILSRKSCDEPPDAAASAAAVKNATATTGEQQKPIPTTSQNKKSGKASKKEINGPTAADSGKGAKVPSSPKTVAGRVTGSNSKEKTGGNGGEKAPLQPNNQNLQHASKSTDNGNNTKDDREPIIEKELPRLAADLIFPLPKRNPRFPNAVYFCRLCACHINTLKYADGHTQTAGHMKGKEEYYLTELLSSIPWPPTSGHYEALNSVLLQTVEEHGRTTAEQEQCFHLATCLTSYFKERLHPGCSVRLYGSTLTGFAVKTSNVNLELIFPQEISHAAVLSKAYELLKTDCQLFPYVEQDFGAKWPCIRFLAMGVGFLPTNPITCVLSVCNGQAHEIGKLLATYACYFPLLVPMAQITRHWVKLCHLDDQMMCGLPSYAFDLMLVHYLQQRNPPGLPIFHEMKELNLGVGTSADALYTAGGGIVQCCIDRCSNLMKTDQWNMAELWLGFLKFYTLDIDIPSWVVNIRSSQPITRQEKDWRTRRFAIEDPFIPNKNVAQTPQQMFEYIMHCFRMSYKYFCVPQTIFGPLFEFDNTYRLVMGKYWSQIFQQQQPDGNAKENVATISTSGTVPTDVAQKELLALIQSMQQTEPDAAATSTTPAEASTQFHYEREEILHLHRDDYEWNEEWTGDYDKDAHSYGHRANGGLDHAKRVIAGDTVDRDDDAAASSNRTSNTSDGSRNSASEGVTYVPSTTGAATPVLLGKEEATTELVSANSTEEDDVLPTNSSHQQVPSKNDGNCCGVMLLGCRPSMVSESSEFSSPDQLGGISMADLSECITEEFDGSIRDSADDSVIEACATASSYGESEMDGPRADIIDLRATQVVANNSEYSPPLDDDSSADAAIALGSPDTKEKQNPAPQAAPPQSIAPRPKERKVVIQPEILAAIERLTVTDFAFVFSIGYFTNGKMPEILCTFCSIAGHHASVCPDKKLPQLVPLPPLPPTYKQTMNRFLGDISATYALTVRRLQWQETFRADLEYILKTKLRSDSRLTLFGSSCNGFGFLRSDLDLCLTFDGCLTLREEEDPLQLIKGVANVLKRHREFCDVLPVTKAKVPIVRFFHFPSKLEGDISLYNCLALRNTELLRTYALMDSRVRALGYIVKVFAKSCDIGDASRGSLSSYAYVLMMLHYLQRTDPPVIPVLQELHGKAGRIPYTVDGYDTYFFDDMRSLPSVWKYYVMNKQSLYDLWLGFLRYYTEMFDAAANVIQMRRSAPLSKFEKLWSDKPLAIEDPFDLNHNLASGLSWRMYIYIMKVFIQAREVFGHPRHERLLSARFGQMLSYAALEKYFFAIALQQKEPPPKDGLCKLCGHVGHFVERCPLKKGKSKKEEMVHDGADKSNKTSNVSKPKPKK